MKKMIVSAVVFTLSLAWLPSMAGAQQSNGNASCVGVLMQSFTEDGVADEVALLRAIAEDAGLNLGELIRLLARETGTLDDCLALIPGDDACFDPSLLGGGGIETGIAACKEACPCPECDAGNRENACEFGDCLRCWAGDPLADCAGCAINLAQPIHNECTICEEP